MFQKLKLIENCPSNAFQVIHHSFLREALFQNWIKDANIWVEQGAQKKLDNKKDNGKHIHITDLNHSKVKLQYRSLIEPPQEIVHQVYQTTEQHDHRRQ